MTQDNTESIQLLKPLNFCVFDLETTGGNHEKDKIIEVGLVRIRNLEITEKTNILIQPEMKIPDFIQKLTSIKQKDVEGCPTIEEVLDQILEFMGDDILIAHNASFDIPFFNSVLRRLGREELTNKSLCTNLMTKYLIPNLMNTNLNYMSKVFGISHKKAHRALDDAEATAKLLLKFIDIFINKGITKINHLYYPKNRFELDRQNFKRNNSNDDVLEKFKNLKSPCLVTIKGENGIILEAFPSKNSESTIENEIAYLKESLETLDWSIVTIKLMGPFIEALVALNIVFNKVDIARRDKLLKFLWKTHLPNTKKVQYLEPEQTILNKEFGDFLISSHLVPEQMLIYPLTSMSTKNELVFRYPAHRKKLLQYINSKSNRIKNNKLKKVFYAPLLKEFVEHYIKECVSKDDELFTVKMNMAKTNPDGLFESLDQFLSKHPYPYNYPKEYI